jgi:hypothetical protein
MQSELGNSSNSALLTISAVPKMIIFCGSEGRRSMMMLNVSQIFARANHEKMSEATLYWGRCEIK